MTAWLHLPFLCHAWTVLVPIVLLSSTAEVQARQPHSLLSPTPPAEMRELATDRPDQTESPYTVDAGHFQLEMDFVNLTVDRGPGGVRVTSWSVAPLNVKIGLLDNADLQLVIDPYEGVRLSNADRRGAEVASGFGNISSRLKVNLWGNDGGRTALAVMGFVRWPLPASEIRHGRTEWGVIFPFTLSIGESWSLGAMSEVDLLVDPAGGYQAQIVNTATLGRDLTKALGMYVEILAGRGFSQSRWFTQLDVGWTYGVRDNVQVDWGANVGVAGRVPAIQPFAGLSFKF